MEKSDKLNVREGTDGNQGVGAFGASCDGSPKASNSSPLVSHTATINMPRGLCNVDVVATFGVPLTTVGDLDVLTKDIEASKHKEVENTNADAIPCKVLHVDDSTIIDALVAENLNVDESPIVQCVNVSIPRKVVEMVFLEDGLSIIASQIVNPEDILKESLTIGVPLIEDTGFTIETVSILITVVTPNVSTHTVEMTNDGFQTVGKKKKKGKSKSTNSGQIGGHSNQPPKATITSTKESKITMSNSYASLEDESDEDVENVYDESPNLFHNKKGESSSTFSTAAG
ncbi:hypothetical protein Tco_1378825 [Tanacetum coccineum]